MKTTGLIKVLKFLKIHNTEYLSGQDLSDVLRISRVAVWKHIKKIQALGYTVESKQKEGYKLTKNSEFIATMGNYFRTRNKSIWSTGILF